MGNIDITQKLSLFDALSVGFQTTLTGLIIVFAVLIILMLVLTAMKYIFAGKTQNKKPVAAKPAKLKKNTEDDELIAVITAAVQAECEEELVAVLTAAVAASLNTSTYNLKIKSYRRIGNNAPAWNKAGLNDVIGSRY